ncbi:cryptochrome/photolyase family protein [Methylomonas methanica]|uniref:Deoxyribodipyrimidine photo-lyase n=1 Tax=Methylomonas methanica (strain DSM 25384 / MC09) TaxID=857087 RepID=G0A1Q7_METMM|nr:deoxyribodipyrimidine photo-lyase [Methylomonas methanica]AEG00118.1 Deoxyribodipyrimidine photo-lyase [Methylomonas methanica MC09]
MKKRFAKSLFIFRRDLRLYDNSGLNAALQQSEQVLACFIFDPRQIEPHAYQSQPGLQFMLEALQDLQQQFRTHQWQLGLYQGQPEQLVSRLHREQAFEAIFVNRDYTPFGRRRDADLQTFCRKQGLAFYSCADTLLNEPEHGLKSDGSAYQVFTAFYNRARLHPVALPQGLADGQLLDGEQNSDLISRLQQDHSNALPGGRQAALQQLDQLTACRDYSQQRDFPALAATSNLSAYLKFGCCSVRETYYAVVESLGTEHPLLRQLYWRDFFTQIAFHFPRVFGHAFHERYDKIVWRNDREEFQAWTEGRTGVPIVDAGMRQLNQTGAMHNRVRMIVASFLVKDLHIDWRWGERYFARHLLDYDPCVNNGNWQWAASTGCDAQPYFRIFNPWLQQKKFDPDCVYIKHWVPELNNYTPALIHDWLKQPLAGDYPPPIVEHGLRSQQAKVLFQQAGQ